MTESSSHDERRQSWKEWIKRRLVGRFAAALAGGSSHAAYLQALGMHADRISLGYDVIDNDHFHHGVERILGENSGLRSPRCFLASARFIEKKNLLRLLRAYADYRTTATSRGSAAWGLVLLGDGELRDPIETLVQELNLTDAVTLPGFRQYDELPAYYARASAFIHASTTEQWGLVVNEAMASGLPVLVSDRCGCVHDLVKEGANGFVFDPLDLVSITQAMMRLTSLPEEDRARMGRASSEIIAQWGPDRFGDGLFRAAQRALAEKPAKDSWLDAGLLALLSRP
jgi:glycosyltransferase involved in cell wall biosynthesis